MRRKDAEGAEAVSYDGSSKNLTTKYQVQRE